MQDLGPRIAESNPKELKVIFDKLATAISEYAATLKKEGVSLKSSFTEYLDGVDAGIKYFSETHTGIQQLVEAPKQIAGLCSSMQIARNNLNIYRQTIGSIPNITSSIANAKRRSEPIFAEWRAMLTVFLDRAEMLKNDLEALLNN